MSDFEGNTMMPGRRTLGSNEGRMFRESGSCSRYRASTAPSGSNRMGGVPSCHQERPVHQSSHQILTVAMRIGRDFNADRARQHLRLAAWAEPYMKLPVRLRHTHDRSLARFASDGHGNALPPFTPC